MNDKFEQYLIENEKRIWTPNEFLYELNRDLLYYDLLSEDFLETASEEELLKESLALFGMLGLANKINKTAMDILARKYKFAAISSAMIWMKKTGITTRCNVGGTEIKNSLDKTTKNPKAGDVIFEDFYKALTKEQYIEYNWVRLFDKSNPSAAKNAEDKLRSNVYFWWALGLDQGVHHLTHYLIIYLVVS